MKSAKCYALPPPPMNKTVEINRDQKKYIDLNRARLVKNRRGLRTANESLTGSGHVRGIRWRRCRSRRRRRCRWWAPTGAWAECWRSWPRPRRRTAHSAAAASRPAVPAPPIGHQTWRTIDSIGFFLKLNTTIRAVLLIVLSFLIGLAKKCSWTSGSFSSITR